MSQLLCHNFNVIFENDHNQVNFVIIINIIHPQNYPIHYILNLYVDCVSFHIKMCSIWKLKRPFKLLNVDSLHTSTPEACKANIWIVYN